MSKNVLIVIVNWNGFEVLEDCMNKALQMGLSITGFNYEVAPGQAEFQVCDYGIDACHQLMMLRYLLIANGESYGIKISFDNCVIPGGKYNHSGCHTNFSTSKMRTRDTPENEDLVGLEYIKDVINNFDTDILDNRQDFEEVFGNGVTQRLAGDLETSSWRRFNWGFGTRCTSIRIPISVARNGYGYLEDRRPGANVDPYAIVNWLTEQVIEYEDLSDIEEIESNKEENTESNKEEDTESIKENEKEHIESESESDEAEVILSRKSSVNSNSPVLVETKSDDNQQNIGDENYSGNSTELSDCEIINTNTVTKPKGFFSMFSYD